MRRDSTQRFVLATASVLSVVTWLSVGCKPPTSVASKAPNSGPSPFDSTESATSRRANADNNAEGQRNGQVAANNARPDRSNLDDPSTRIPLGSAKEVQSKQARPTDAKPATTGLGQAADRSDAVERSGTERSDDTVSSEPSERDATETSSPRETATSRVGSNSFDPATVLKVSASGKTGLDVGDTIPEIKGGDAKSIDMSLSDYRGQVVMLDFWGDW